MRAGGEWGAAAGPLLPGWGWSGGRQPSPGHPAGGATGIPSGETFPSGSEAQRGEVAGPGRTGAGNRSSLLPFGPSLGLAQASDLSRGGPPRPRPQAGQVRISRFFLGGHWRCPFTAVGPGPAAGLPGELSPDPNDGVLALLAPGQRQATATRFRRFRWFNEKTNSGLAEQKSPASIPLGPGRIQRLRRRVRDWGFLSGSQLREPLGPPPPCAQRRPPRHRGGCSGRLGRTRGALPAPRLPRPRPPAPSAPPAHPPGRIPAVALCLARGPQGGGVPRPTQPWSCRDCTFTNDVGKTEKPARHGAILTEKPSPWI